jgi:hypothetical protein
MSARVFVGDDLHRESLTLLDFLRHRFSNMQVAYGSGSCPEIYLRGRSSIHSAPNPSIYVDGNRATNTCILSDLTTVDLERVEIYPSGIPGRPGYFANPDGVIIVFTRKER